MSWLDDLTVRLQETSDSVKTSDAALRDAVGSDVYSFLKQQFTQAGVKLVPQLGNLSAEQIKDGMRGQTPGLAPSNTPMAQLQNSLQAAGITPQNQKMMLYVLMGAGALGLYVVFFKKRRRG